jgi:6-phosphogluconolactonase/glucosamine-6-phosphate isomerase/deaminase
LLVGGGGGHICSRFQQIAALEGSRRVVPAIPLELPARSLTVAPPMVRGVSRVFVLAVGEDKTQLSSSNWKEQKEIGAMPIRMALRTILLKKDDFCDE